MVYFLSRSKLTSRFRALAGERITTELNGSKWVEIEESRLSIRPQDLHV